MTSQPLPRGPDFEPLEVLAFAHGRPGIGASIKQHPSDFCVDEELGFAFTGSGEHLCVRVRKTDLSTPEVAKRLSAVTGVPLSAIGYAGMKDRRAQCSQWFSLKIPQAQAGRVAGIEDQSLSILELQRNGRKLRIGSHKLNHFTLLLRQCGGPVADYETRLQALGRTGVPNYFGPQRFGHDLSNLTQARALLQQTLEGDPGRQSKPARKGVRRGMLLSAARSYLFNQVLSRRVAAGNWASYVSGDVMNLNGSDRCFQVDPDGGWNAELQRRLAEFDIHSTGPLPGVVQAKDRYLSRAEAADIEVAVLREFASLVRGLERCDLMAARRALRFVPVNLQWQWRADAVLQVRFALSKGCYATSLLRELCLLNPVPYDREQSIDE